LFEISASPVQHPPSYHRIIQAPLPLVLALASYLPLSSYWLSMTQSQ
jgi:hypothetical protein